jgi:tripartite ATP-independent transporter DctP family solute receptor
MRFRRSRVLTAGAATLATFAIVRERARSAQFTYKLGNPNPVDFPPSVRLVQWAKAVKDETNGRLDIQVFPNAQLGSVTSEIGQLRLGSMQFMNSGNSTFSGVVPVSALDSVGFAFTSEKQAHAALDGALGDYIRKEFAAKGLYVFEKGWTYGFRETTSSSRPIRNAADFTGFKMRVSTAIVADLFRTLGASPVPLDAVELYTSLQTHVVDGQETPLSVIESYRLYEVQKYLSLTNHIMTAGWLVANAEAWNALPPDIQEIVKRNAAKYALMERKDLLVLNTSLGDKLTRQGFTINTADTASMRARLGPYYARQKSEFGNTAWTLLESAVGKLG